MDDYANANVADIENIIRSCGLYKTKARDIKYMAVSLRDNFGGVVPNTIEKLTSLPGVGRKTANLIMGDVYGQPCVVADTHLIRITNRLGLSEGKDAYKVEMQIRKIINPDESCDFCHRMVQFGRDVCSAQSPKCNDCEMTDICKEYKSKNK